MSFVQIAVNKVDTVEGLTENVCVTFLLFCCHRDELFRSSWQSLGIRVQVLCIKKYVINIIAMNNCHLLEQIKCLCMRKIAINGAKI